MVMYILYSLDTARQLSESGHREFVGMTEIILGFFHSFERATKTGSGLEQSAANRMSNKR